MNKIEKHLYGERERLKSVQAPESLEQTLKSTLTEVKPKRKNKSLMITLVTAMMLFVMIGYNYNALAYYSKKILGFEENLYGTLKDLNENDMGQPIDKSIELHDGTVLTVNGMMTDENQLVLFYTLSNENGLGDGPEPFWLGNITGFLTNATPISGSGTYNEEMTELKFIQSYEPVNPFAKKLTLHIWQDDADESDEITFNHDPNKAMRASLNLSLNETFEFDIGTLTVKSIRATPTMTIVEGRLDMDDMEKFDHFYFPYEGIQLIANGYTFSSYGSGSRTDVTGTTFDVRFDALPQDLESLQLSLQNSIGYEDIHQEINLETELQSVIHIIDEREMVVKDVEKTVEGLAITVATDYYVMLDKVAIETGHGKVSVHSTMNHGSTMQKGGRYMNESTYIFDTDEKPETLIIEGIYYKKEYNQTVDIKIDK